MSVYFWCPDVDHPSGGVRAVYRFVDALNAAGAPAAVLHQREGFRARWFDSTTSVRAASTTRVTGRDVLVVSELDAPRLLHTAPGVTKVVLNQHQYWTFSSGDVDYRVPDVALAIAVSEDGEDYLSYAFPGLSVARVHYAVDTTLFHPRPGPRTRRIAYLPGKGAWPRTQVLSMLRARGALAGWELREVRGLTQEALAELLGRTAVLCSFSEAEGFQMLLTEAMASGCAVVGYHAGGGREFFTPEVGWPVPAGEIVGFARTLADLTAQWDGSDPRIAAGTAMVRQRYTLEREAADVVTALQPALARAALGDPSLSYDVSEVRGLRHAVADRARLIARAAAGR